MATTKALTNKLLGQVSEFGRSYLNTLYPNDIELYLAAMELVDSLGNTVKYFVFPVMPNSIQKTEQSRNTIKKSSSGTTVLISPSHVPSEIQIKGDFGRGFKILTSPKDEFVLAYYNGGSKDALQFNTSEYSFGVKSGFGCIKIMQSMVQQLTKLDQYSKPYRLYFYNLALSESYLVTVLPGGFTLLQSYDRNMIWSYTLTMQTLANLDDIMSSDQSKKSAKTIMSTKTIQSGINAVASEIKNIL